MLSFNHDAQIHGVTLLDHIYSVNHVTHVNKVNKSPDMPVYHGNTLFETDFFFPAQMIYL